MTILFCKASPNNWKIDSLVHIMFSPTYSYLWNVLFSFIRLLHLLTAVEIATCILLSSAFSSCAKASNFFLIVRGITLLDKHLSLTTFHFPRSPTIHPLDYLLAFLFCNLYTWACSGIFISSLLIWHSFYSS